jgi:hypothetical protein
MKYILVISLIAISFLGGVFFENSRLVDEPDKTVAIMLSKQAIDNSKYQLIENAEYLSLLENQDYKKLMEKIESNSILLAEIRNEAESLCNQVACSEEQKAYLAAQASNNRITR